MVVKSSESINNGKTKRPRITRLVHRLFGRKNTDQGNHNYESAPTVTATLDRIPKRSKERLPFSRRQFSSQPELLNNVGRKSFSSDGVIYSNGKLLGQGGQGKKVYMSGGDSSSTFADPSTSVSPASSTEAKLFSDIIQLQDEIQNLQQKECVFLDNINENLENAALANQREPSAVKEEANIDVFDKINQLCQNTCSEGECIVTSTQFNGYSSNGSNHMYKSEKILSPKKVNYKTAAYFEVKPWGAIERIDQRKAERSPASKHEKYKTFRRTTWEIDQTVGIGIPWTPDPVTQGMAARCLYVSSFDSVPHHSNEPKSYNGDHISATRKLSKPDLASVNSTQLQNQENKKVDLSIVNCGIDARFPHTTDNLDMKVPYFTCSNSGTSKIPDSATSKLKLFEAKAEKEFSASEIAIQSAQLAQELIRENYDADETLANIEISSEDSFSNADDKDIDISSPAEPWKSSILGSEIRNTSPCLPTRVPELSSPALVRELRFITNQGWETEEANNYDLTTGSDENPSHKFSSEMESSEEIKRTLQVVEVDIHRNNVNFDNVPSVNGVPPTENGLTGENIDSAITEKLESQGSTLQETSPNHKESEEIPKTSLAQSATPTTKKILVDPLIENGDPRISLTPMRNVEESELVISTESHDSDGPISPGYDATNRRQSSESFTDSFKHLQPFNFNLGAIHEGKRERLYKVLVVGELGTGKTSIIKRYVHQFFSQHYRATIGVDFALKVLRWDPETVVRLQLWDIAGQERFGSMTRVYYKEAVGAFVVFDVTRSGTLDAVQKWKNDLDSKVVLPDGRPIPTVLLANKSDQPKEGMAANREKMNEFCKQNGFAAWFETSAKENIHIDEAASFLVSKILEMDRWSQEPMARDPEKLNLGMNGKYKPSDGALKNCAC